MKHLKKIKISSGTPPYDYTWLAGSSCVNFDNPTGTSTTGFVDVEITTLNEACYTQPNITLDIIDSKGCKKTEIITITNPCTTFLAPKIHYNGLVAGTYNFTALPIGGTGPYTYFWSYESKIFNVAGSPTSNKLKLSLINNAPYVYGTSYPVTVVVTDANGCERTTTYNYTFCRPVASSGSISGECGGCQGGASFRVVVDFPKLVSTCSNTTIDWSTLTLYSDEDALEAVYTYTNNSGLVVICIDEVLLGQLYDLDINNRQWRLNYTITDNKGNQSLPGVIYIAVPDCVFGRIQKPLQTFPITIQADCAWTLPYTVNIPLLGAVPLVIPGSAAIDWTTFTFIPNATQTLNTAISMDLADGNTVELDINKNIKVVLADIDNTPAELIRWKVCDINGFCSQTTSTILELDCLTAPVAVDDDFCVECGEQTVFDILDNDTGGNISNSSTINITVPPSEGTVVVSGTILNYTANPNYFGADIIKYTVTDDNGLTSNEAEITITVACAGNPENIINCNP